MYCKQGFIQEFSTGGGQHQCHCFISGGTSPTDPEGGGSE